MKLENHVPLLRPQGAGEAKFEVFEVRGATNDWSGVDRTVDNPDCAAVSRKALLHREALQRPQAGAQYLAQLDLRGELGRSEEIERPKVRQNGEESTEFVVDSAEATFGNIGFEV